MFNLSRKFPSLDDATKVKLDKLSLRKELDYAYDYYLLGYGVNAVIQNYLMKKARDISNGKINLKDFIEKYNLNFTKVKYNDWAFFVPLNAVEKKGIFIPADYKCKELDPLKRGVKIFDTDYGNILMLCKNHKPLDYLNEFVEKNGLQRI